MRHEAGQIIRFNPEMMNRSNPLIPWRLVVKVETPLADGQENIACSRHLQVGDNLSSEHFSIKFQTGVDIQGKQMSMMDMIFQLRYPPICAILNG